MKICGNGCLFHFHAKATERISIKLYSTTTSSYMKISRRPQFLLRFYIKYIIIYRVNLLAINIRTYYTKFHDQIDRVIPEEGFSI